MGMDTLEVHDKEEIAMKLACPVCGRSYYGRVCRVTSEPRGKHVCLCGVALTYRVLYNYVNDNHTMTITARI